MIPGDHHIRSYRYVSPSLYFISEGNMTSKNMTPCVMAECNTGDINNRRTTMEICNMVYCSKSKCDQVECPKGEGTWNRTNIHIRNGGTQTVENMNCTSFGFTSARRNGILGGYWKPSRCISRQRVAIIIPFRDREEHLCILLKNLLPILILQQLEFRIFVVEQVHTYL
jgi:hypothetical protein